MINIKLEELVNKLEENCRSTMESAIGIALTRTHYTVEIEHWLLAVLKNDEAQLKKVLADQPIDYKKLEQDILNCFEKFKTGNSHTPSLSGALVELLQNSWVSVSIHFKTDYIYNAHILFALLSEQELLPRYQQISSELGKIDTQKLTQAVQRLTDPDQQTENQPVGEKTESTDGKKVALKQYTMDLTALAKAGKIDPVIGRESEIRQIIDILTRRRQNNPILTGEAGVGKTAVAEGFALRIAKGDVPPSLQNVSLLTLDLALLQAGAGVKGEFERRLKEVIKEVQQSSRPIILFIDEAHNMIGAGNQAGQGDAANLLKPALARGELRTIAATTWAEYKKYVETDAALTRRFQVVTVDEPSEEGAINMMRGVTATLEKHHKVLVLDEAVQASVRLSMRYIPSRQLPDKSISLLDTAAARVHISQSATPPNIEDSQRKIEQLTLNIDYLNREQASGVDHEARIKKLQKELNQEKNDLKTFNKTWKEELKLVKEIGELRKKLEKTEKTDKSLASKRIKLQELLKKLKDLQGETPLIYSCVDAQIIASVIAEWTGIPLGRMLRDEVNSTLSLKESLEKRILGQATAVETISKQLQTARANLHDPQKPRGVFLFVGSSGIGKTEMALTLAEQLYGGEQNLTVINMSEFKESHKISMLSGSPPGYVGYGEGGILTEAVRRKPYSVILLDEMEKAHPSVQEVFYQVFDKGMMMDGEGRKIDFKNTLVLMASNVGTQTMMQLHEKHGDDLQNQNIADELAPELSKHFKAAFLGRVNVVPFCPLGKKILHGIVIQKLDRIRERIQKQYNAKITYANPVITHIVSLCQNADIGARVVDNIINNDLLPELSLCFLKALSEEKPIRALTVKLDKKGNFVFDANQKTDAKKKKTVNKAKA